MLRRIIDELKDHGLFTAVGAVAGIVIMVVLDRFVPNMHGNEAQKVFDVLHPLHVILSAMVTAAIYQRHVCPIEKNKCSKWMLLIVGYLGAIGIATLSDSLIPYLGEQLLGMEHAHAHIGIIEDPLGISLAALFGILIAYYSPVTKFPHAGHVFLSTAASLFHVLHSSDGVLLIWQYVLIFFFLFISVWLPCCFSDIAFPLLFIKNSKDCPECGHEH